MWNTSESEGEASIIRMKFVLADSNYISSQVPLVVSVAKGKGMEPKVRRFVTLSGGEESRNS